MAESDNWVFDSLVGFLRGPVWNVPILTFIEHKSLGKEGYMKVNLSLNIFLISVFEPEEDEQNEEEYKKIHDDYKNLVRKLIFISQDNLLISIHSHALDLNTIYKNAFLLIFTDRAVQHINNI